MQKRLGNSLEKIMLLITVCCLLTTAFSTTVISNLTQSSISKQESDEVTQITAVNRMTQDKKIVETSNHLCYTINFSIENLRFDTLLGFDLISIDGCSYLSKIGKPMLPVKHLMIAMPSGLQATGIQVISTQIQPLPGLYTILPVQQPQHLGALPEKTIGISDGKSTYFSPLPYPSNFVSLGTQTDLAGQSMIDVTIYPLHYLPLQKKISLLQSIEIVIEGVEGYICQDYLPESISDAGRMMYEQMVRDMVFNPEDVALCSSKDPQALGVEPGDYDYVIITQESWVDEFQPLADWKTQKGVPATIVTTNWIYNSGGYSGTDVQKIRAFVQDVYTNWGTIYILLGGDIDVVPCHYKTISGVSSDPVPNDVYYADFDDDWVCEVHIGRASVDGPGSGTGQIGNFINKILTYEITPPLTNYAKKAGLFGFDLDSWTHAEQCKINIDNTYIPASWTMTNVYDSDSGNHLTNVIAALNAGQNLANHADHSNTNFMGTGWVNHDLGLEDDDMDALTNGNKQTILYSMGCDPAAFDVSDCIAEHFVENSNGGGIAFIGNTRYGWYNYGTYDTLSMLFDVYFFKSIFQDNLFHLGAAFSDHKNDAYQEDPGYNYYKYIFTELTLLGDPELPVWTENPSSFAVSHPETIPLGSSSFTVHVETTTGSNIQNAYVCLWKSDEIYQCGSTNSAGDVTFTISPESGGSMQVTVTKQNYLPSETSAGVIEGNLPPYEPSSPDPMHGATNVPISSDLSWTGGDPNPGDIVTYDVYFGTSPTPPNVVLNQSETTYDPGILDYLTTYYWKIVSWDNSGETTAGSVWVFTTKANSPPVFGAPSPANGSTGNPLSFTWSIPIYEPEGETFSWTIQCSNGQTNSAAGASNGTKSLYLSGLAFSTMYSVWVNATDPGGSDQYTRQWYNFMTKANLPPVFGASDPVNGSINQPLSFTWSIPIFDPEGDDFDWSIECSNGQISSGTTDTNGTKTLALSSLVYSTSYMVWVNATDPTGSNQYKREWYTFTTKASLPPVFGIPSPTNGSTGQPLAFSWSILISDPEGDDFDWSIECSNGQISSDTVDTNGTKTLALSDLASSTTYTVWVNATDTDGSNEYTREWFIFTTQSNTPPNKPDRPSGETNGKINTEYTYTTSTTDPDNDQLWYQWDWGDGTQSTWLGPYDSGDDATADHTWTTKGDYSIKVKAKDTEDAESDWSEPLAITMPFSYDHPILQFFEMLFERFPNMFPILRHLLGY